jgi:hypothetical protein
VAHQWRKKVCSTTACAYLQVGGGAATHHHHLSGGAGLAQQQLTDALEHTRKAY